MSDVEAAIDEVVYAGDRPSKMDASDEAGIGTESTINCPCLKAFARKDERSSTGVSE